MRYIFYGPEGSGKTTQAKKLAKKLKLPYISTGDMVRYYANNDKKDLGKACQDILNRGVYLSDYYTHQILSRRLNRNDVKDGFVLDGFPRNLKQAKFLNSLLSKQESRLTQAFFMQVSKSACVGRVMLRKRDNHDTLKKLLNRMDKYYQNEVTTLTLFQKNKILTKVNAEPLPDKVFKEICLLLIKK